MTPAEVHEAEHAPGVRLGRTAMFPRALTSHPQRTEGALMPLTTVLSEMPHSIRPGGRLAKKQHASEKKSWTSTKPQRLPPTSPPLRFSLLGRRFHPQHGT